MTTHDARVAIYTIPIDGQWNFEDLSFFPRVYEQLYAFEYAFIKGAPTSRPNRDAYSEGIFARYPWRGGWSAVGFYQSLISAVPLDARPQIVSIEYGSPGNIKARLSLGAAVRVAGLVAALSAASMSGVHTYNAIYSGAQERDLLRMQVQAEQLALTQQQIEFIDASVEELAEVIGFEEIDELKFYTPSNLAALKILMAEYRRGRDLNRLREAGLLELPSWAERDSNPDDLP